MKKERNEAYESIRNDFYYRDRVKDLYETIRAYEKYVIRFTSKSDYYTVVDLRNDAIDLIENFEKAYPLSNDMRIFLRRRVARSARATGIL